MCPARLTLLTIAVLFASLGLAARTETVLSTGWLFAMAGGVPNQKVRLPHTWNRDDGAVGNGYYRGPATYKREILLTDGDLGKRLFLRFGAASLKATVLLNGHVVGSHRGGFTSFVVPLNGSAKVGANILEVTCDNARDADITPLNGDFTVYGGLYRPVWLIRQGPVGISLMDEGGPGVYVTHTRRVDSADVSVTTLLSTTRPASVVCRVTIRDAEGGRVARAQKSVRVDGEGRVSVFLKLDQPRLWDGVRDPYLYKVTSEVLERGKVVDKVTQPLGVRTFEIEEEKGFFLNGKPYDLHGVNLHQGRPTIGWAATAEDQDEDYRVIHELGCTGVRMAHYPHAPHEWELTDRYGLVTWGELALVNQMTDSAAFKDNAAQQLREFIKQTYNHPSFCVLSAFNEPWHEENFYDPPDKRKKGTNNWEFVRGLNDLAKELRPELVRTGAMMFDPGHPTSWLTWIGDAASYNKYWGWYGGSAAEWGASLDKLREAGGGKSFGISEFGAGGSLSHHEDDPKAPAPTGRWHPEEYQTLLHSTVWPQLAERDWLWCKFLWVMYDFPSDIRHEGDADGINDKGLVTGDRKVRKDAYYYYQAQWSRTPMVHVESRRFSPRPAGQRVVRVFSNCEAVLLSLDGQPDVPMTKVASGVFESKANLEPGSATVSVVGLRKGKRVATDLMTWKVG